MKDTNENDIVKQILFGHFKRLAAVARFNVTPQIGKESVAEHSYYVALYSWVIYTHLFLKNGGTKASLTNILSMALMHDADEAISGDIITPTKEKVDLHTSMENISEVMIEMMVSGIPDDIACIMKGYWRDYKSHNGLEYDIVKLADLLSCASRSCEQVLMGNYYFLPIVEQVMKQLHTKIKSEELFSLVSQAGQFLLEFVDEMKNKKGEFISHV